MEQPVRIVVTGGAGFLGSHLCEKLVALGHQVICLDNLLTGRRENTTHLEGDPNFEFRVQDVTEPFLIDGPVDAVVHGASPASPPDHLRLPIETLKVGSIGTLNALELAKNKRARFLLTSTSEVYGEPQENPQPESYWGNVNPVGPRSVYDESKRFAEALTVTYHRTQAVDVRIARIFNTYGPRMRLEDGRVISNFIVQALQGEALTIYGDGSQTRSFCYVTDMIEGLIRLLLADREPPDSRNCGAVDGIHGPINMGNPVETTVRDLAQMVLQLTGSSSKVAWLPLPTDDPKVRCPDIRRAQKLLGWQPTVTLEDGLVATIDYFRRVLSCQRHAG